MTTVELPGRAFRKAFGRRSVEAMADRRLFERGLLYAANGRAGKRTLTDSSVKAKVRGSSSYQVRLSVEDGQPGFDCSCPVGMEGRFCKHIVALALVATDSVPEVEVEEHEPIDLRGYLTALDHLALVDLLLERAAGDGQFDARLRMDAARTVEGPLSTAAYRHALDQAFTVGDFVEYGEMWDYTCGIDAVLRSLRELLGDGHAEAVKGLVEHAVDLVEDVVGYVDDSSGYMSVIAEELQDLHLAACRKARPDAVALADLLFERELNGGDLDIFAGASARYARVLGKKGLAEYRRLGQVAWDPVPALGPGDKSDYGGRFRITKMMETLAELTGDVDAVVGVLSRDQSSAYQFVRIAEFYTKAERYDDALAWAEKGLALHGGSDSRLVVAAAQGYHRAGRGVDAVRVAWDAYDASPGLRTYQQLAEQAARAGLWEDWHDKALSLLRERIGKGQRKPARNASRWATYGVDSSTLVEVLLFDGEVEQAWAEASAAGCRRDLWLKLAGLREGEHPLDAIPIWQEEIERQIDAKNNQAYAGAVSLIVRVRRLMKAAGREADFSRYTAQLRTKHKPKRNLMKLFDGKGW